VLLSRLSFHHEKPTAAQHPQIAMATVLQVPVDVSSGAPGSLRSISINKSAPKPGIPPRRHHFSLPRVNLVVGATLFALCYL
jgi:hypothetical protein